MRILGAEVLVTLSVGAMVTLVLHLAIGTPEETVPGLPLRGARLSVGLLADCGAMHLSGQVVLVGLAMLSIRLQPLVQYSSTVVAWDTLELLTQWTANISTLQI